MLCDRLSRSAWAQHTTAHRKMEKYDLRIEIVLRFVNIMT